jgi:hypothetical protein
VLGPEATDLLHVLAVFAHDLGTLAARFASLFAGELVSASLGMRGATAETGDLALLLGAQRRKPRFGAIGSIPADLGELASPLVEAQSRLVGNEGGLRQVQGEERRLTDARSR